MLDHSRNNDDMAFSSKSTCLEHVIHSGRLSRWRLGWSLDGFVLGFCPSSEGYLFWWPGLFKADGPQELARDISMTGHRRCEGWRKAPVTSCCRQLAMYDSFGASSLCTVQECTYMARASTSLANWRHSSDLHVDKRSTTCSYNRCC